MHHPAEQLRSGPAQQPLGGGVDEGGAALAVDRVDPLRQALVDRPAELELLAQLRLARLHGAAQDAHRQRHGGRGERQEHQPRDAAVRVVQEPAGQREVIDPVEGDEGGTEQAGAQPGEEGHEGDDGEEHGQRRDAQHRAGQRLDERDREQGQERAEQRAAEHRGRAARCGRERCVHIASAGPDRARAVGPLKVPGVRSLTTLEKRIRESGGSIVGTVGRAETPRRPVRIRRHAGRRRDARAAATGARIADR